MALTAEQQALVERERLRMAELGYRDTLESPPSELLRVQQPLNIKLRSECSCLCSQTDEYGRALRIGWCGPDCERRRR